jgi:hypothetical protein
MKKATKIWKAARTRPPMSPKPKNNAPLVGRVFLPTGQ